MSASKRHNAVQVAEIAMGTFQELSRQGGANAGTTHGVAQLGSYAVQGAAVVAPIIVAKAGFVAAATVAAATAAAPLAVTAAVGFGAYKLYRKFAG